MARLSRIDSRFVVEDFEPRVHLHRRVGFRPGRGPDWRSWPTAAPVCNCHVDRLQDKARRLQDRPLRDRLQRVSPLRGGGLLRGLHGSGTIFFSFCNLTLRLLPELGRRRAGCGRELARTRWPVRGAELLQEQRLPQHQLRDPRARRPSVLEACRGGAEGACGCPSSTTRSAYDSIGVAASCRRAGRHLHAGLQVLETRASRRYLKAKGLSASGRARRFARCMPRWVTSSRRDGLAHRGVLVRHLVTPGRSTKPAAILGWLAREVSPRPDVNVMVSIGSSSKWPRLRTMAAEELDEEYQPQAPRDRAGSLCGRAGRRDLAAVRRAPSGVATVARQARRHNRRPGRWRDPLPSAAPEACADLHPHRQRRL